MRKTRGRSTDEKAFLLGAAGALGTVAVLLGILFYPATAGSVGEVLLLVLPLLVPFAWCAYLRLWTPAARAGLAPAGYAFVFLLLGLFLCMGDPITRDPMAALFAAGVAVATFLAGCIGQLCIVLYMSRTQFPRGRPKEPTCPYCGYGLYYARNHVCPECGEPFLGAEVDMRLARWEDGVLKPITSDDESGPPQEERSA